MYRTHFSLSSALARLRCRARFLARPAMADARRQQIQTDEAAARSFDERRGLLVDADPEVPARGPERVWSCGPPASVIPYSGRSAAVSSANGGDGHAVPATGAAVGDTAAGRRGTVRMTLS